MTKEINYSIASQSYENLSTIDLFQRDGIQYKSFLEDLLSKLDEFSMLHIDDLRSQLQTQLENLKT